MKLRQNSKDWRLLEDELGNPIFKYLDVHPGDVQEFINNNNYKGLESEVMELEAENVSLQERIQDLEAQLQERD